MRDMDVSKMEPMTKEELRKVKMDLPILVRVVCIDYDITGEPDWDTEEWQLWDGEEFSGYGSSDDLSGYGVRFLAYADPRLYLDREAWERYERDLKDAKETINDAYWVAWARDFQEPGTPENERLHVALQDVMLALKGQIHTKPERAEAVKIAEKELARVERSLAGAKKRGAPAKDIENLEKKVAYKRLVLALMCRE